MPIKRFVILGADGKRDVIYLDPDDFGSGASGVPNIEGGSASSLYLPDQCYDGGDASGN